MACTLFSLLLSGTAQASAYPIREPDLTKNKLYGTGALEPGECHERDLRANDVPSAKRYLTAVLNCLNTSWGAHFKRAGMPFSKSGIGFITKPRRYCGNKWGKYTAAAYCDKERRFLVLLDKDTLSDPEGVSLMQLAAHEYGHHIQNITGMARAFDYYPYKGKKELNEQVRRNELQAECLSGVFVGSVWESLGRDEADWDDLVDATRESGDEWTEANDHGKGRNMASWLDKGFRAVAPKACNTWVAPSSKVS
ncbi:neutral zinc metallopeptidase [Nonomuraea roseoviolacea]|uniref:Metalloprotease n=1 Tax=Nonomuraea roseoviolacea subsp. carminata TaxID=160689 RepID=A0ABT1JYJ7_9ACTN|nr:neutral zinc metallopeptidase [Nonomuraea roseoviolacea]MCP2346811.1 putative metalloprotease [Nonomuraea roseoviolacea subsp. carminata]